MVKIPRKLIVRRACYGKKGLAENLREYRSEYATAVGSQSDWLLFAKEQGFDAVVFYDHCEKTIERRVS